MTTTAEKLCIAMAWAAVSALVWSIATPAMAEEAGASLQAVLKVLDSANAQVHADMMELEMLQVPLPIGVKPYYSEALSQHLSAKANLQAGNFESAKKDAMEAMKLYRTASDLLSDVEDVESSAVIEEVVEANIGRIEQRADYITKLALANNVSITISEYQSVINDARQAITGGDIDQAKENLALAESIIANVQNAIQASVEEKKLEKAEKFVEKMINRLSKIVDDQEKVNQKNERDSLIDKLKAVATDLDDIDNFEGIMSATDDSSALQKIFRDYKTFLGDVDESNENKDEAKDSINDSSSKSDEEKDSDSDDDENNSGSSNGGESGSDDDDNSGSGNGDNDVEDELKRTADELEDRAEELLDRSNNPVADLKINEALDLIETAEDLLSDDDHEAASALLSSAEALLDLAEALI